MTLDEAIKHCEEVAEKYCEKVEEGLTADDFCDSCASEHRQLAEWLRELKYIKTMTSVYEKIRKGNMKDGVIDAIDDHDILFNYFKQIKEVFEEVNADDNIQS